MILAYAPSGRLYNLYVGPGHSSGKAFTPEIIAKMVEKAYGRDIATQASAPVKRAAALLAHAKNGSSEETKEKKSAKAQESRADP